ncbi:probable LRR receptor-like serine/threonine-protein kinase At3g47570 [Phragmites australis]|uniref:probable LRR receptor-like serine/threonine-protein kinase At3g47570 n=1 Tax=Phragmites australis TaxID=29695 RepID=UPI002D799307|nr:probable LRR receptor-like serine/threonine-protein kinase At3g47570 [Phragmites australis]
MAMESMTLLLLLSASMSISTLVAGEAKDEAALLAFKAAAVSGSPGNPLASWNSSSTGGFCSWDGVTCGGRHRRVVALSLSSHGLTGILSPAVGNLSFLRVLNLGFNGFSGDIPASLGRLRRLQALNLSYNIFSGELPANLTSWTSLRIMALASNHLRGCLPPELGDKLTRLETLLLWGNNLTGTIPVSLANLSSLSDLELGYNQLEGAIPPGLDSILGLQFLDFAFNRLSSKPPVSLYNLSSLEWLQIQGNMLHGSIPADIGSRFPSMQILSFSHNKFTGTIPSSLSNLTTLQRLDISKNKFSGYVPGTLGRLRDLQVLLLWDNLLEADDREGWEFITSLSNCSQLQTLDIGANAGFTGQLPSSTVNLSSTLQYLNLHDTGITGSIPSAISNLVSLNFLDAGDTSITGVIPESISKLGNLAMLVLYNTCLSGFIPSSIGNLSNLNYLDTHIGNLEGPIPATIGKLKNLFYLDLSKNRLSGPIPKDIFKLRVLSRILDLSYNALSGPLPSEVGSLQNLNQLLLSGNQLSGEIPDSIGECTVLQALWLDNNSFEGSIPQSLNNIKGLSALNLSMNRLSGTIPDTIGSIRNLQQLYLAHNYLSGPIPTILQNLTSLSELDLSFNNLQGEVPKEGIFRNLANFSITGNNELCGGIPQLHLAPCHMNSVKKNRKGQLKSLTVALATIGALLFLAFVIVLIQLNYKKLKRRQKSSFQPPEEQYERVSYNALANGTNGFSEANLLGEGSFGAVYKCTMKDEGTIAAVKVFNLEQAGSARSFVAECEALRRVRHRCLIKIITCCSSINHQGQEFKALVFEFMPNGSLNDWLHPKFDKPTLSNTLSLAQRLDIAIDVMDALDYLHNHCQPPIIHCDLKPSNILLAEDMSARVGDFGISRILQESARKPLQNSNSTIGIRGSIGYVAPEYGEVCSISTLGDVYSLGILLLEMFTGRSPTDDMFGGSLDLHKFSEDALPERIWEIVDSTMWLHTDTNDSTTRSRIQDCLVSVVALGICCSKKQPRERTPIQDAAIEMHAIRDSYLKFAKSHVVENGVAVLQ